MGLMLGKISEGHLCNRRKGQSKFRSVTVVVYLKVRRRYRYAAFGVAKWDFKVGLAESVTVFLKLRR